MFFSYFSLVAYHPLTEAPYAHSETGKHVKPPQTLLSVVVEVTHKVSVRRVNDLIGCLLSFIKQEG